MSASVYSEYESKRGVQERVEKKNKPVLKVDVQVYLNLIKALEQERTSWEPLWIEVRDNISPEVAAALTGRESINNGRNRQGKVMTSSPQLAVKALASGMQGGLVSPSRMWFDIGLKGGAGNTSTRAKQWLGGVRETLRHYFNEADIYGAMYQLFSEMALFGQGVILIEKDPDTAFRFTTLSCGDYWLDTNHKDEVDTLMRKSYYSARGLVQKYGELRLPENIREEARESMSTEKRYEVIQIIQPRKNYNDEKKDPSNMPWESVHIFRQGEGLNSADEGIVLRVGGFKSKPFVAPRWEKLVGRVYGSCPARVALPDIKMLYQIMHEGLKGLRKAVSPPVVADGKMKNSQIRLQPNGVTYAAGLSQSSQIAPIYQTNGAFKEASILQDRLIADIREVFYANLFTPIMNRDKNMSATEVSSINAEKLGSITPVIELLEKEALDYIFERCFSILLDIGDVIPPAPQDIQGSGLRIDYVSILAQAQKMSEITGINQFITFVAPIIQMNPESNDVVDWDKSLRKISTILCQEDLVKDIKEVTKIRKSRAKAQQSRLAADHAQQTVSTMKEASETDVDMLQKMLGMDGGESISA